jgi:hypothetical protein
MKRVILTLLVAVMTLSASAQSKRELLQQIADLNAKIEQLNKSVAELEQSKVSRTTPCDEQWEKWKDVRYNYGFNTKKTPIFNTINGVLESTVMLSVRGGLGRWNSTVGEPYSKFVDGGHLFEGWNASESCRLTLLIGKQAPDIACIQVYSPKGLYRTKRHFGWVKLGSDDAREGVDFGRRWALSFVPFTLGRFDKAPTTTYYRNEQIESTAVPVGTLYYNTANDKIGCYTKEGWKYLKFE